MDRCVDLIVLNDFKNDARVLKEAVSLRNAGYGVRVIALHEEGLPEEERVEGIPVYRIRLKSKRWPKWRSVQLLKYLEFLYRAAGFSKNASILHCNDLSALPVGVGVRLFSNRKVKIVYDSHEYQAQLAGVSKLESRLSYWLERVLIPFADHVIVVSESIAEAYRADYGIEKPSVILNAPPRRERPSSDYFRRKYGWSEKEKIFLYQGRLARHRGLEKLIEVFSLLPLEYKLVLMGHGTELKDVLESLDLPNVFVHPPVDPSEILEYTASADFGIHPIRSHGSLNHEYCLPNKLFEYTMAGIPVIASDLTEMRRHIEKTGIGTTVDFEKSPSEIAEEITVFAERDLTEIGKNLERAAERYNWQAEEKKLLDIYRRLG